MTEQDLQKTLIQYVALQYPSALYKGDPFNGLINIPIQLGAKAKAMGNRRGWPDFYIADPCRGFSGLYLELKKDGFKLYRQDGKMVSDTHIQEQAKMLEMLRLRGYYAEFAVGFDRAKELVDWYLTEVK